MKYYIGLMSGTSLDGVDCVVYDFDTHTLIHHSYASYTKSLKTKLKSIRTTTLENLINIELEITDIYISIIKKSIKDAHLNYQDISAIGMHGQTIYHQGGVLSKQLGLGDKIAYQTKIPTICDFRSADILAGGQGAPLTPKYHQYLLDNQDGQVVNLGGIANITKINNGEITGYDTGPANTLIDNYMLKLFNIEYDRDGLTARSGFVLQDILEKMLDDAYFKQLPPKSTGVEYFNFEWVEDFLTGDESPKDVIRTLTELTAQTIADNLETGKVYFCGGGVFNAFLMERIQVLAPQCEILTTMDLGINPQFIEAIAFAYFSRLHIEGKTGNIPSVSGATKEVILGVKYQF